MKTCAVLTRVHTTEFLFRVSSTPRVEWPMLFLPFFMALELGLHCLLPLLIDAEAEVAVGVDRVAEVV